MRSADVVSIADIVKLGTHRTEYDPRNLDNLLRWVNGRRAANGLPLFGLPTRNAPEPLECSVGDSNVSFPYVSPPLSLTGGYDLLLGGYR
jgi:hypothetical protein